LDLLLDRRNSWPFTSIKLWVPAGEAYRLALAVLQWPFRAAARLLAGDELPALASVSLVADPVALVALVALVVPLRTRDLLGQGVVGPDLTPERARS
jgi:hypothetical protein